MQKESRGWGNYPRSSNRHSGKPKTPILSEQCYGANDESNLEQRFSAVKAVGTPRRKIALNLQLFGLFAHIFFVACVMLQLFFVLLAERFALFLVQRCNEVHDIRSIFGLVLTNTLCLVLGPAAGGLGFLR